MVSKSSTVPGKILKNQSDPLSTRTKASTNMDGEEMKHEEIKSRLESGVSENETKKVSHIQNFMTVTHIKLWFRKEYSFQITKL